MSQPALKRRVFLHELAHAGVPTSHLTIRNPGIPRAPCCYASDPGGPSDVQGLYHWARHFDDGNSCMDYDLVHWTEQPPGTFNAETIDDAHFEYCPLDRYLMGLLPKNSVGPLTNLRTSAMPNPLTRAV